MGLPDGAMKLVWYGAGSVASTIGFTALGKVADAAIDAGIDLTQDYIYTQLNAKLGTQFDNPFLKSFMTSLKMSVVSDASATCMGMAMRTNMKLSSKIDAQREKIQNSYKTKMENNKNSGGFFSKKAKGLANQKMSEDEARKLGVLDNQAQNYFSAVNGAGTVSGAYTQGLGTMKSGFQATVPQTVSDPNMLKLVNGLGYFPDRS